MNRLYVLSMSLLLLGAAISNSADAESVTISEREDVIANMFDIGSVQFGEFTLKVLSGYINTPIYLDLRRIMSHPKLLKKIVAMISKKSSDLSYDLICGVPDAATAYAVGVSLTQSVPLIMPRKIVKQYGTGRTIEGVYVPEQRVLMVEDVTVSGASVIGALNTLEGENLKVTDVIIVCDREQGAVQNLKKRGLNVHVLFTLSEILETLRLLGKINRDNVTTVKRYLADNQCIEKDEF